MGADLAARCIRGQYGYVVPFNSPDAYWPIAAPCAGGDPVILRRYWFEFAPNSDLHPGIRSGCGVTAFDLEDTRRLRRELGRQRAGARRRDRECRELELSGIHPKGVSAEDIGSEPSLSLPVDGGQTAPEPRWRALQL